MTRPFNVIGEAVPFIGEAALLQVTVKKLIGLPPVAIGGVKLIVALALPAVALPMTGGPGATGVIVTPCVAVGAARKLALPAWSAVSVQTPAATIVTVVPLTVHTAGVAEP